MSKFPPENSTSTHFTIIGNKMSDPGHIFLGMCPGVAGAVHPDLVTVSFQKQENKCSFQPNKLLFIFLVCIVDMLP